MYVYVFLNTILYVSHVSPSSIVNCVYIVVSTVNTNCYVNSYSVLLLSTAGSSQYT